MSQDYRESDDNPAGRIYNILHRAQSITKAPSAFDAWVEILLDKKRPIDEEFYTWDSQDLREVMIRLAEIHRLLDEAVEKAQNHDIPVEPYERHLESLRQAMTPGSIAGDWGNTKQYISPPGLLACSAFSAAFPPRSRRHCAKREARRAARKGTSTHQSFYGKR